MYCQKCGNKLNDESFCDNCNEYAISPVIRYLLSKVSLPKKKPSFGLIMLLLAVGLVLVIIGFAFLTIINLLFTLCALIGLLLIIMSMVFFIKDLESIERLSKKKNKVKRLSDKIEMN